jgi:transposase-like protein
MAKIAAAVQLLEIDQNQLEKWVRAARPWYIVTPLGWFSG